MTPEDQIAERRNEVSATLQAADLVWPVIAAEFRRIRAEMVERLVAEENPELRGRIKQIDELLHLPNNLRQELLTFTNALPEESGAEGTF